MMEDFDPEMFSGQFTVDRSTEAQELPLLPVRDTILFPRVAAPLFVSRERSTRAVEAAMAGTQRIAVFAQKDAETQEPGVEDLYELGTEAVIGRVWRMPDQTTSVFVQGRRRLRLLKLTKTEPYLMAHVLPILDTVEP
jgi:ATP-dependent Lon protease